MRSQKIRRVCFIALTICLVMYTAWHIYGATSSALENECEGIIRFHVVANSDSAEDQRLKMKVRDGLLKVINQGLVRETMSRDKYSSEGSMTTGVATLTIEESRQYLQENMTSLEALAAEIVSDAGYEYPVAANLGVCWIPEKSYGEITFPAGNYEALNIRIGEGNGQNWWCVLYPPLCLIDAGSEVTEDAGNDAGSEVAEASSTATSATSAEPASRGNATGVAATTDVIYAGTSEAGTIKLKFKTLEILNKAGNIIDRKRAAAATSGTAMEKYPGSW